MVGTQETWKSLGLMAFAGPGPHLGTEEGRLCQETTAVCRWQVNLPGVSKVIFVLFLCWFLKTR